MNEHKEPILSVQLQMPSRIFKHSMQCQREITSLFSFITSFLHQENVWINYTEPNYGFCLLVCFFKLEVKYLRKFLLKSLYLHHQHWIKSLPLTYSRLK